jgi:hypothetical protein
MATETEILFIEINQSIKIQQNKAYAEERVLRSLEEAKRILLQKEIRIKELTTHLKMIHDAAESGGIIKNESLEQIKILIG